MGQQEDSPYIGVAHDMCPNDDEEVSEIEALVETVRELCEADYNIALNITRVGDKSLIELSAQPQTHRALSDLSEAEKAKIVNCMSNAVQIPENYMRNQELTFEVGDRVNSKEFGDGTIVAVNNEHMAMNELGAFLTIYYDDFDAEFGQTIQEIPAELFKEYLTRKTNFTDTDRINRNEAQRLYARKVRGLDS